LIVNACNLIIFITCEDSPFNLTTREGCSPPWPEAAEASFLWSFLHKLWSSPHFSRGIFTSKANASWRACHVGMTYSQPQCFSRAISNSEGIFTSKAKASWRACHEGMTYSQPQVLGWCLNQQGLWNCHATSAMLQKQGGGGQQEAGEQSLQLWPGAVR
jgi:hypothetical protein